MQGSRYLPRAGANLRFHDADGTNALTRLRFANRADNHHGQPIRARVMDPLSSAEMRVDRGTSCPLLPRFNGAALFRARRFLVQDPPHVGGESNRGRRRGLDVVFISRSPMGCGPKMRREITEVVTFHFTEPGDLDWLSAHGSDRERVPALPLHARIVRDRFGREKAEGGTTAGLPYPRGLHSAPGSDKRPRVASDDSEPSAEGHGGDE